MENVDAILKGLDEAQAEAVQCLGGPMLIVAGAGSGKTRVLTSRIAYLLENGAAPEAILALTFTKKAANEMKERIALMVGAKSARRLCMGTFHSVFVRFLRDYAESLGYPRTFTIYDTTDSQNAIKRVVKEMGLDEKIYKPREVLSRISIAKNNLITVQAYRADAVALRNDSAAKKPHIVDIYAAYQSLMKQSGVMDFDDILVNMNILIQNNKEAYAAISSRFDHILVDEYQDTNLAQYTIIRKLAQRHRNICVVGDDSQSIYAFRGAKVENMFGFTKDYPDCRVFFLKRNYRSTKNIVNAANSLIACNPDRIPKTCFSDGETGEKIRLVQAYTEMEEAVLVASSIIARMQTDHASYQDFAILYRTNAQSRALEEALRRRNLPYMIYSGNSFFERQEVKDMMAYLKLAVNPSDDESFRRIVNKPARGIGDTTVEALSAEAKRLGRPLMETVFSDSLQACGLRGAAIQKLRTFAGMILSYNAKASDTDAYEVASALSGECGLYRMHKEDKSLEGESRAANIEELVNSVKAFVEESHNNYVEDLIADGTLQDEEEISEDKLPVVTLGAWLENVSLLSSVDVSDEDAANRIALMTVHSAKGLEFPYVYVTGLEENLFPSGGLLITPKELQEERRLFYVALTRARKAVILTFASTRMRNGRHESNPPSRFVREISPDCVANPLDGNKSFGSSFGESFTRVAHPSGQSRPYSPSKRPAPQPLSPRPSYKPSPKPAPADDPSFGSVSVLDLRPGQRIEHNRFGLGTVKEISGPREDLKAKIAFDSYGEKILLLKYAKIRLA